MNDTIGTRIRQARKERGLKQHELAERAGISTDMVSLLERGERGLTVPTMYALAGALGIEPDRLLGKRERLAEAGRDRGILRLRDALQTTADLPGLEDGADGGPVSLADLEAGVDEGWRMYWKGQFALLAAHLPDLITAARATEREHGGIACRPLAQAYQLSADLMVHMGSDDLAFAVARRGLRAADRSGDPLQYAALAGTLSWVRLHQGCLADAERVARAAAENIQPRFRRRARDEDEAEAQIRHLTVYGSLLLSAAAPAAAAGDADAVASYMGEAQVAALRFTGGDRHDYNLNFGPTQMAMQAAHQMAVLSRPDRAIAAAKRVNRADLLPISWGAMHLDKAQAYMEMRGKVPDAVDALLTAYGVSPEWCRHQGLFRNLGAAAVRASRRREPEQVRKLRAAVGMALASQ